MWCRSIINLLNLWTCSDYDLSGAETTSQRQQENY